MVKEGANSGTATGVIYDVFLSFRGPDTRKGFTDFLYVHMTSKGIRIFRDAEELQPGERISEILRAIESSKIYILVFSKNYAASEWCLKELTQIVKCTCQSTATGKVILPIFYDVDPSDVKLETDLYKSALAKHEEDLGCAVVKPWKEALTTVTGFKGWHLKDQWQGQAVEDITQTVLMVLQKSTMRKRDLPAHLVGIDDRIEAIKELLDSNTSDIRFVIIHGIGGIGKTTLANAVFNELSSLFEGCSFLSSNQESSPCNHIVEMQRKLVEDLFDYSLPKTLDFEEGNKVIKKILPCKRVLLVFDGMNGNDQFKQLAKQCTLCCPRSRIIITTRDMSDFTMTMVEGLATGSTKFFAYEMEELHFDHALQLCNKLACNTDSAPFDRYDLSKKVVALTGGLPLAIEEIVSLVTKSKAKWESKLEKLKEVPHEKVYSSLKMSYDALGHEARQIFLDIACFFVNKKISNAMYMWKACNFYPEVEIDTLMDKSLIKIDDHDKIRMYEQVRDLGREIIRQENIEKPGGRSRLWFAQGALNIIRDKKGIENVVALKLWKSRRDFTRENFANLRDARFLELDGGNFVGNFEDILPDLMYLCWRNCPTKLQANNFVLNSLVVLKLSGDINTGEWSRWVTIIVASKLKVLKITGSKSLIKTACFSEFVSLERLILKDFLSLTEIDRSIGQLERLTYLKIKWCPSLKELPKEIGCLNALRELILIQDYSVRYLPDSIGYLRHLSRLVMEDMGIDKLPDTINGLVDLQYLCLAYCTSLNSLPDAVGELKSLTELDLSGTSIEKLPQSLSSLQDLKLRINKSLIRARRMGDLLCLEDIEDCWSCPESDSIQSEDPPRLLDYPREIVV